MQETTSTDTLNNRHLSSSSSSFVSQFSTDFSDSSSLKLSNRTVNKQNRIERLHLNNNFTDETKARFSPLISIRTLLTFSFFIIFAIAWSLPIYFVLDSTARTVSRSLRTISAQTAKNIVLQLSQSIDESLQNGRALANMTHEYGVPSSNASFFTAKMRNVSVAEKRRIYRDQIVKSFSRVDPRRWPSLLCRWRDGSSLYFYQAAKDLVVSQLCVKPENAPIFGGVWQPQYNDGRNINSIPAYPSTITQCEVSAFNITTRSALPTNHPANANFITLRARTFALSLSWNQTILGYMRPNNILAGMAVPGPLNFVALSVTANNNNLLLPTENAGLQISTNHFVKVQGDPTSSAPKSVYYDPANFGAGIVSAIDTAGFAEAIRQVLPPDPSARAFFTSSVEDDERRVLFWSHGSPINIVKYNVSEPIFLPSKGCYLNGRRDLAACLYNISTYEPYRLLKRALELIDQGDNFTETITSKQDSDLEGNQTLLISLMHVEDGELHHRYVDLDENNNNNNNKDNNRLLLDVEDVFYSRFSGLKLFERDMSLHLFIPAKLYMDDIRTATITVIIVTAVMILVGLLLAFLILTAVTSKIEKLAHEMYKDPFAVRTKKRSRSQHTIATDLLDSSNSTSSSSSSSSSDSSSKSSFFKRVLVDHFSNFVELDSLENHFEDFRREIEKLRGFMPFRTTRSVGTVPGSNHSRRHRHHRKQSTKKQHHFGQHSSEEATTKKEEHEKSCLAVDSNKKMSSGDDDDDEDDDNYQDDDIIDESSHSSSPSPDDSARNRTCNILNNKSLTPNAAAGKLDDSPSQSTASVTIFTSPLISTSDDPTNRNAAAVSSREQSSSLNSGGSAAKAAKGVKFHEEAVVVEVALENDEAQKHGGGGGEECEESKKISVTEHLQQQQNAAGEEKDIAQTAAAALDCDGRTRADEFAKSSESGSGGALKKDPNPAVVIKRVPVIFEHSATKSNASPSSSSSSSNTDIQQQQQQQDKSSGVVFSPVSAMKSLLSSSSSAPPQRISEVTNSTGTRYMIASFTFLGSEVISEILLKLSSSCTSADDNFKADDDGLKLNRTRSEKPDNDTWGLSPYHQQVLKNIIAVSHQRNTSSSTESTAPILSSSESNAHDPASSSHSILTTHQKIHLLRQYLVDRSKFIVDTVFEHLLKGSGAHVIEYRNDNFLICLRLSLKTNHSRLSQRFLYNLVKIADQIFKDHELFHKPFVVLGASTGETKVDRASGGGGSFSASDGVGGGGGSTKESIDHEKHFRSGWHQENAKEDFAESVDGMNSKLSSSLPSVSANLNENVTAGNGDAKKKKTSDDANNPECEISSFDFDDRMFLRRIHTKFKTAVPQVLNRIFTTKGSKPEPLPEMKTTTNNHSIARLLKSYINRQFETAKSQTSFCAMNTVLTAGIAIGTPFILSSSTSSSATNPEQEHQHQQQQRIEKNQLTKDQISSTIIASNLRCTSPSTTISSPAFFSARPVTVFGSCVAEAISLENEIRKQVLVGMGLFVRPHLSRICRAAHEYSRRVSDILSLVASVITERDQGHHPSNETPAIIQNDKNTHNNNTDLLLQEQREHVNFISFFAGRSSAYQQIAQLVRPFLRSRGIDSLDVLLPDLATMHNDTTHNHTINRHLSSIDSGFILTDGVRNSAMVNQSNLNNNNNNTPVISSPCAEFATTTFSFLDGRQFPTQKSLDLLSHAICFVHETSGDTLKHPSSFFAKAGWTSLSSGIVPHHQRRTDEVECDEEEVDFSHDRNYDENENDNDNGQHDKGNNNNTQNGNEGQRTVPNDDRHSALMKERKSKIEVGRLVSATFPAPLKALLSSNLTPQQQTETLMMRLKIDEEREAAEKNIVHHHHQKQNMISQQRIAQNQQQ